MIPVCTRSLGWTIAFSQRNAVDALGNTLYVCLNETNIMQSWCICWRIALHVTVTCTNAI
jgi:hypothetical protein